MATAAYILTPIRVSCYKAQIISIHYCVSITMNIGGALCRLYLLQQFLQFLHIVNRLNLFYSAQINRRIIISNVPRLSSLLKGKNPSVRL